jgi:hypothetical protein
MEIKQELARKYIHDVQLAAQKTYSIQEEQGTRDMAALIADLTGKGRLAAKLNFVDVTEKMLSKEEIPFIDIMNLIILVEGNMSIHAALTVQWGWDYYTSFRDFLVKN